MTSFSSARPSNRACLLHTCAVPFSNTFLLYLGWPTTCSRIGSVPSVAAAHAVELVLLAGSVLAFSWTITELVGRHWWRHLLTLGFAGVFSTDPPPGLVDGDRKYPACDPLRTAHDRHVPPIPASGESKMDRGLALELRPVSVFARTVLARCWLPDPLRPCGVCAWQAVPRSARPVLARSLDLVRLSRVDGPCDDQLLRVLLRTREASAHVRRTDPIRRYSVQPVVRSFRLRAATADHRVDQYRGTRL